MMATPRRLGGALVLACVIAAFTGAAARAQSATATDLRAAFLLNFTRFTDWPALAPKAAFTMCILGDDAVAEAVRKGLGRHLVFGREFQVEAIDGIAAAARCHLLFVGDAARVADRDIVSATRGRPVLTVSNRSGFAQSAGIIELFVERDRMRFAINVDEVQRSGLTISSRLLTLAKVVHDKP